MAEVQTAFPRARLARADSDVLRTPARARAFWEEYDRGLYDVVVGTQMALRAADDGAVGLAALANADAALTLPDFRAAEWTFRTIRRLVEAPAAHRQVVIQTFFPDHYAIASAVACDYDAFARAELAVRARLTLPPFSNLINIIIASRDAGAADALARQTYEAAAAAFRDGAAIIGPLAAAIPRLHGFFRRQLLVKADVAEIERQGPFLAALSRRKGKSRITVDVDPYDLF